MTSAYDLNSPPSSIPFVELKEDQYFIPPLHQASSSLSSPIFFNLAQDQRPSYDHPREQLKNQHKANKHVLNSGGSSGHQALPSSSVHQINGRTNDHVHELSTFNISGEDGDHKRAYRSTNYPSDVRRKIKQERIMQSFRDDQERGKGGNGVVRTCSDCNTTKTPLWRSGPQGPKSLCNACGIRQRKARRAMAAAAAAGAATLNNQSPRTNYKVQKKENKMLNSFNNNMPQRKEALKLSHAPPHKLSFEDFALSLSKKYSKFERAFPKDEEEAAAVLLMALSCGLLHG